MSDSYEVVPYEDRFKEQVLGLVSDLWGGTPEANRAYFTWKHERNPYTTSPLLYLALHCGHVVGMRSFFGVCWEGGTPRQRLTGLYADDMIIAPEHRNRGLVRRIMDSAFEGLSGLGYEYLFNLSAGPVTQVSSLSMGWRSAGSMQPMRRGSTPPEQRPSRLAPHLSTLPAPLLGVARRARQFLRARREDSKGLAQGVNHRFRSPAISFGLEPRIDAMAALVETADDDRVRHLRDRTYLAWRLQNPQRTYGYLFFDEDGLEGYLILQENAAGLADRRLNIVDWEGKRESVLGHLLEAAGQIAGDRSLWIWSRCLSSRKLALLTGNGFQPQSFQGQSFRQPKLLVRALAGDRQSSDWLFAGRRLTDLTNWDIRMLDSMHG